MIVMIVKNAVHLKKFNMANLCLKINNYQNKNTDKKLKNMCKNNYIININLLYRQIK